MSKPAQFMPQAANKISTNNASNPSCQKQGSGHKGKRKATDSMEENSEDVVEEGPTKSGPAKKQKKEVTGVPTQPTGAMLQYNTASYTLYDPKLENVGTSTHAPFASFASYNDYTLYMNPNVTDVSEIPTSGLRLDDMTVAFVVKECGNKKLKECWPAEFDTRAMVSGRRLPLGDAAKEYKKEGDVDVDGNILSKDQERWYYLWLKGLHELSGQEGLDYKTCLKRPAFEKDRVPGLTWKISSKIMTVSEPDATAP